MSQITFQFQSGAVKSLPEYEAKIRKEIFQFQSGAVKSFWLVYCLIERLYFNSKVVRLKDQGCEVNHDREGDFNSKVVRLKAVLLATLRY